ncbi:biosynthetic peptidoglycan transglycosylase [Pelotomaculum isophthalicicum]
MQSGTETLIYDKDGNLITQLGTKYSVPVSLNKIPEQVKDAFLSIEDPHYYEHHGFSLRGIARAAWNDLDTGSLVEGGSTITQQLVKMSFLSPEKTIKRKIQEVIHTTYS